MVDVLADHGFEPCVDADGVTLTNCPFHALVQEETELVCGMNLAFVRGLLDGIGAPKLDATLDPAEGRCCVRIKPH